MVFLTEEEGRAPGGCGLGAGGSYWGAWGQEEEADGDVCGGRAEAQGDIWRGAGRGQGLAAAPSFPPGKWGR